MCKNKPLKLLEGNTGEYSYVCRGEIISQSVHKKDSSWRERLDIEVKLFYAKATINKVKTQTLDWKNMFSTH